MVVVDDLNIRVIDCDTHIIEPYDLWTSRVPKKWREDVPRVVWNEEHQQDVWTMPGMPVVAAAAGSAMAGWREYPPDRPPTLADADPATWNAGERLKLMDNYGVYAQLLYPNIAGFGGGRYMALQDAELRLLCVRAYNDWLTEWASEDPNRFITNCALPFWDVEASVDELRRCHAMGHRGVLFSSHPNVHGQPYIADPHWDPIWSACQELDLPINFHIGSGGLGDFDDVYEGNGRRVNYARSVSLIFMTNGHAVVDTIFAGICDRFPTLKFVSVESGVGWMPFLLEAMDWQWKNTGLREELPLRQLPSEYFRRQFYGCFWFERGTLAAAIEGIGEDNILYETDFPHPTSQSPGPASAGIPAKDYIEEVMAGLPETTVRKILHDNAAKLYHLDS
jgi:uncharacterized protein